MSLQCMIVHFLNVYMQCRPDVMYTCIVEVVYVVKVVNIVGTYTM